MSVYAVFVTFRLRSGTHDRFVELVRDNARTSVADEPGCLRFDILAPPGSEDVLLYEIYTDRSAFDAHLASSHFLSFDAATRDLVAKKTVTVGAVIECAKAPAA